MRDEPFDGCSQCRDFGVVFFVPLAEFSTGWCFPWSGYTAALVAFIADPAAGIPYDLRDRRFGERGRVMGAAGERIGNVDSRAVE
jgi:hypothetical protein